MTYDNALNLIIQKQSLGIKPGLSRICELLNKMGNPQQKLNIIHIAGTNGKGTVACAIAGAMQKAGYRVGCISLILTAMISATRGKNSIVLSGGLKSLRSLPPVW